MELRQHSRKKSLRMFDRKQLRDKKRIVEGEVEDVYFRISVLEKMEVSLWGLTQKRPQGS